MPPIGQSQFDQDLQTFVDAVNTYIAAVTAFLALPPVIDLSNEDATVQTALQAVQTAQGQLPPPLGPAKPAA